jgi:hypothetical protein
MGGKDAEEPGGSEIAEGDAFFLEKRKKRPSPGLPIKFQE